MNRFIRNASAALALTLSSAALAADPVACKTVRLGVVNWTDVIATSAMAEVMLEGLGYQTEETTASQQIIMSAMADDNLDVFLGYWQPTMIPVVKPFIDKGQVKVMESPILPDAQSTFAVPDYVYEAGLKTFADIAKYRDKLDGKIYGIEPGSGANRGTAEMIKNNRFGLKDFQLVESSEAGMLTAVKRAEKRKDWIVFFGWKPHPMNLQIKMHYLTGSEDVFGPNEGLATVSAVTTANYPEKCPNVAKLVGNLHFTSAEVGAVMAPILDRTSPQEAAKAWLKQHPGKLETVLDGVTTLDGKNGLHAVKASL
ncbi:glycine betaine/proline transport system substrate-binding protein [Pseudomonas duriflava]|uniref:Glycine betaine/proline transport system substrate-binding protein n=1 Tax=Pseudomonas duriflava TaxID=459528 RepID=A0A562QID6_9PSED|nr:choline ABC transporter substrate-binding protein [Pseudomonas duriflava]TWI56517.1 glycine betaine/proline transport system substrate-binding protein [Pseudomonas duriflava]